MTTVQVQAPEISQRSQSSGGGFWSAAFGPPLDPAERDRLTLARPEGQPSSDCRRA